MNILIIDDDSDDREIIKETIEHLVPKVNCTVIESGEEAVRYLRQTVSIPDFIFVDINMTGMDGKECLLKIKSMKAYYRTRIIMYSGNNDENEKIIYRKLGANGYINKTGSLDHLKSELKNLLIT
jgi:DNA-binding response OmpR family regulator